MGHAGQRQDCGYEHGTNTGRRTAIQKDTGSWRGVWRLAAALQAQRHSRRSELFQKQPATRRHDKVCEPLAGASVRLGLPQLSNLPICIAEFQVGLLKLAFQAESLGHSERPLCVRDRYKLLGSVLYLRLDEHVNLVPLAR